MSSIIQLHLFNDKHCSRRGLVKSLDDFRLSKKAYDSKQPWCKACEKEYKQQWYIENREKQLLRFRKNRERNKENSKAYDRAYYITHKKELNAQAKKWHQNNREAHRVHWHTRRARERRAEGSYTVKEWRALLEWFGSYCLRCGAHDSLTVDHVIPLTKGGANHVGNLQPLCKMCNSTKREQAIDYRDPIQVGAFLGSLPRQ